MTNFNSEGSIILYPHTATGADLYATIWSTEGYCWNFTDDEWVFYTTAAFSTDYELHIDFAELGTASQVYKMTIPNKVGFLDNFAGTIAATTRLLRLFIYVRAGANPAEGDTLAGTMDVPVEVGWPSLEMAQLRPHGEPQFDKAYVMDAAISSRSFDNVTAFPVSKPDKGGNPIARGRGQLRKFRRSERKGK